MAQPRQKIPVWEEITFIMFEWLLVVGGLSLSTAQNTQPSKREIVNTQTLDYIEIVSYL